LADFSQSTGLLKSTGILPVGEYDLLVQATDPYYTSDNFELDINVQNNPPVLLKDKDGLNISYNAKISYPVSSVFKNLDKDALIFTAKMKSGDALPSWLNLSQSTGWLNSTGKLPLGEYDVMFQVNDTYYNTSDNFELDINVQNHPPVAIKSNVTVNFPVNETFTYDIKSLFTDSDGDKLTYLANLASGSQSFPSWLTFSENDGKFSGVPIELGNYTQSNPK